MIVMSRNCSSCNSTYGSANLVFRSAYCLQGAARFKKNEDMEVVNKCFTEEKLFINETYHEARTG